MSQQHDPPNPHALQQHLQALEQENRALRSELDRLHRKSESGRESRQRLLGGGARLLVPLLDRQRVVRSFGKLATTASEFSGPSSEWPTRERILAETREFLESCVRFTIRRRTLILLFSLFAATVPAIQIWLVFKQNHIIENQTALAEIQVYDIVARSMNEGDRNARQMTGALLANAKLEFLQGVIDEAFDPGLVGVYRAESVNAAQRRLEDAAFRGHLIRAVVRGVERRGRAGTASTEQLYQQAIPMFRRILVDTTERVPEVLRLGRQAGQFDDAMIEQVDNYLAQVGGLLIVYGRLARAHGEDAQEGFFRDIAPLYRRLASQRGIEQSRFEPVYRSVMQDVLFDLAVAPRFGTPPANLEAAKLTPEAALAKGIATLRKGLGADALDWKLFEQQVSL